MLKRSNIVAAEEDLQAFYRELDAYSLAALWSQAGGGTEPRSKAVPFVWHWRDVRLQAMRAAELVTYAIRLAPGLPPAFELGREIERLAGSRPTGRGGP